MKHVKPQVDSDLSGWAEGIVPMVDRLQLFVANILALLPMLLIAAAVLVLFAWLAGRIKTWDGLLNRVSENTFVQELLGQALYVAVLLLGALIALEILDATAMVGALLGTAGVVGIALGFAFRDTIENYIAGVLLSIKHPFLPNEHIKIEGYEGKVIRLTARATILMNFDGNHVRIPNSTVFKGITTNYSRNPVRRFKFELGLGSDVDLSGAAELAVSTILNMRSTLDEPAPSLSITALGDSNVVVAITGWVDQHDFDFTKVRSEAIRLVKIAFEEKNYDMPEPIYRLNVAANIARDGALKSVLSEDDTTTTDTKGGQEAAEPRAGRTQATTEVASDKLRPDKHIDEQIASEQATSDVRRDDPASGITLE